ncbi:hypothetical protein ABE65_017770 [Fictibacillus phosphorivorans]|uniref:Uncharacterized protein n=2 Tax=Fictibacillus phosphorivorans TaxID=1221500 RepID=A0A160IQL6_9BACL|nr:hypothetical protein ABE65_017770 [Fictibacillus phosphorivorans]
MGLSVTSTQPNLWYSKEASRTISNQVTVIDNLSNKSEEIQATSSLKSKSTNIWEDLSSKYDIRNATFEEIKEISSALYQAGEVSIKDISLLTFDFDKATNNIKRLDRQGVMNGVSPDFNLYETKANEKGQRDWIKEISAKASKDFGYGNLIGYHNNLKTLDILKKLER